LGKNVLEYDALKEGEDVWGPQVEKFLDEWVEASSETLAEVPEEITDVKAEMKSESEEAKKEVESEKVKKEVDSEEVKKEVDSEEAKKEAEVKEEEVERKEEKIGA